MTYKKHPESSSIFQTNKQCSCNSFQEKPFLVKTVTKRWKQVPHCHQSAGHPFLQRFAHFIRIPEKRISELLLFKWSTKNWHRKDFVGFFFFFTYASLQLLLGVPAACPNRRKRSSHVSLTSADAYSLSLQVTNFKVLCSSESAFHSEI